MKCDNLNLSLDRNGKDWYKTKVLLTGRKPMIVRLPGLVDSHVHLRVPGGEYKEDFHSGSRAAIAGGFTTILAMPNTNPPITTPKLLTEISHRAKKEALCDVLFFAGVSPESIDQLPELSNQAVALKIYMNQTYGPLRVNDLEQVYEYYRHWKTDRPIALHAEDEMVNAGIHFAAETRKRTHFCHISRKRDIELIARGKQNGLPISCEVTPHHLFLSKDDLERLGNLGDMRPTLGSRSDVEALWDHLGTTIDCIASDHAPHTLAEKQSAGSPPGVPGLETSLPLMLTAVSQGKLSLERLIELMSTNPKRIYGIQDHPDTWVEVETEPEYVIKNENLYTKCKWSPFNGMKVKGRVVKVVIRCKIVFENGKFSSNIQ